MKNPPFADSCGTSLSSVKAMSLHMFILLSYGLALVVDVVLYLVYSTKNYTGYFCKTVVGTS
ncbi:MAG: hypothetical protein DRO13_00170 [Thermoprotei archaeon]|nr:MAG: hypothetical protein DRO13_00095 [Thermoprotei archaeon]RLG81817.1 MAG: hypothetical protein DRO13_00170 [Thermoprotei archaeon]